MRNTDDEFDEAAIPAAIAIAEMRKSWKGLWVVEFSHNQRAFHVEEAENRIGDSAVRAAAHQARGDWICIGVFNSQEDAVTFMTLIQNANAAGQPD